MEPLRIRCRPIGLVANEDVFPLDTLLYRALLVEEWGADYYLLPTQSPAVAAEALLPVVLPLEKREKHGQAYWACSWANLKEATLKMSPTGWVRGYPTKDAQDWAYHRGRGDMKVQTSKGADKLYNTAMRERTVDELVWYAVGDAGEIGRLLNTHYTAIGKKSAYGHGQLSEFPDGQRWQVEPWPFDWSEVDGHGRLTRAVPVAMDVPSAKGLSRARWVAIRPPYWAQCNRAMAVVP